MDTTSYWSHTASPPTFKPVQRDLQVDVVVVGAGITGVTAAYFLKNTGHRVALVERGRVGGFDSMNTTAHLTCVTDKRMHELVVQLGRQAARQVWEAGLEAVDQIATIIADEKIACDFTRIPGYLHVPDAVGGAAEVDLLREDARLANELGFPAVFLDHTPLLNLPGVEFQGQAKFNPGKYLSALLKVIEGSGSHVFERSEVAEINPEATAVRVGEHTIHCRYVILATHAPAVGMAETAVLLQSKTYLYTSYAVGARIAKGKAPEASFWETGKSYRYLRVDHHPGYDYAILGGEDHKTGQSADAQACYARLEQRLDELFPGARADHRWSGQVVETSDGLPFIGETAPRQFLATGFSGNGMTFGTFGAMMAMDAFLGRTTPWTRLFDPHRKLREGTWEMVRENKDYPYLMVRDWLGGGEGSSLDSIQRGQGRVVRIHGQKLAAYRNEKGRLSLLSAVCPHLKCIVTWNNAESTWDCPCHGSRFAATGEVLSGPALAPMSPVAMGATDPVNKA